MLADPEVDIGIPTVGTRPYLTEALESVFAQTVTSWRLVLSEDGPGLGRVSRALEPYADDPRIQHVLTGDRVGIGPNHTNLFRDGRAPYLAVLHDDDRWHPQFLERRLRFMDAHPNCGFVYSGHVVMNEEGRPLGRTEPRMRPGVYSSAAFFRRIVRTSLVGFPSVMIRRKAYEAVGGEWRDVKYLDWDMWIRLSAHFDVGVLDGWDAEYRIHGDQMSARRTELTDEQFALLAALADVPMTRTTRRLMYSEAHARSALDALERGDRRLCLGHLGHAVRIDPLSVARPIQAKRMLAAIGALIGGERGRSALINFRQRRAEATGRRLLDMPTNNSS